MTAKITIYPQFATSIKVTLNVTYCFGGIGRTKVTITQFSSLLHIVTTKLKWAEVNKRQVKKFIVCLMERWHDVSLYFVLDLVLP